MQIAMVLPRKIVLILALLKVMQKKTAGTENQEKKTQQFRCFYFLEGLVFSLNQIAHVKPVIPTRFSVSLN